MQELLCFSAFVYQYIEFFVFLKVARRGGGGGYSPLGVCVCACVCVKFEEWLLLALCIEYKVVVYFVSMHLTFRANWPSQTASSQKCVYGSAVN